MHRKIKRSVKILRDGGIIAYPTEGVFGLGCDPFNETAVLRLLKIKRRKIDKGLILIAANWQQVKNLVKINLNKCCVIKKENKNPITWVFPATKKVPHWISGRFNSIAIRVTKHPVAKKLCQKFGGPIVSTSANLAGKAPAKNFKQIEKQFVAMIDFVVPGKVGNLKKPTQIRDAVSNRLIRD
jgi:L-threonylcarbamoyladenylate synthase